MTQTGRTLPPAKCREEARGWEGETHGLEPKRTAGLSLGGRDTAGAVRGEEQTPPQARGTRTGKMRQHCLQRKMHPVLAEMIVNWLKCWKLNRCKHPFGLNIFCTSKDFQVLLSAYSSHLLTVQHNSTGLREE